MWWVFGGFVYFGMGWCLSGIFGGVWYEGFGVDLGCLCMFVVVWNVG